MSEIRSWSAKEGCRFEAIQNTQSPPLIGHRSTCLHVSPEGTKQLAWYYCNCCSSDAVVVQHRPCSLFRWLGGSIPISRQLLFAILELPSSYLHTMLRDLTQSDWSWPLPAKQSINEVQLVIFFLLPRSISYCQVCLTSVITSKLQFATAAVVFTTEGHVRWKFMLMRHLGRMDTAGLKCRRRDTVWMITERFERSDRASQPDLEIWPSLHVYAAMAHESCSPGL